MPFPLACLIIRCRRVRVQALRDVCEETEAAPGGGVCERGGLGLLGEGRRAGGVCLWHFDGCGGGEPVMGLLVGRVR